MKRSLEDEQESIDSSRKILRGHAKMSLTSSLFKIIFANEGSLRRATIGWTKMLFRVWSGISIPKIVKRSDGRPISSCVSRRAILIESSPGKSSFPPGRQTSPGCELNRSERFVKIVKISLLCSNKITKTADLKKSDEKER